MRARSPSSGFDDVSEMECSLNSPERAARNTAESEDSGLDKAATSSFLKSTAGAFQRTLTRGGNLLRRDTLRYAQRSSRAPSASVLLSVPLRAAARRRVPLLRAAARSCSSDRGSCRQHHLEAVLPLTTPRAFAAARLSLTLTRQSRPPTRS